MINRMRLVGAFLIWAVVFAVGRLRVSAQNPLPLDAPRPIEAGDSLWAEELTSMSRPTHFEALLNDICRSYKAHGFVDIILLGDSDGNQAGMEKVARNSRITESPIVLGQNASMTILHEDGGPHPSPNENSLVVRLDLGTTRVLLMGDAEAGGRQSPAVPPSPSSIEAPC